MQEKIEMGVPYSCGFTLRASQLAEATTASCIEILRYGCHADIIVASVIALLSRTIYHIFQKVQEVPYFLL